MKRILLAFSILLSAALQLAAQTAPPSNLAGDELKTWLKTNWYDGKHKNLDYSTARGKMYNYIDNYNNKVTCVYSGYQENKTYSETGTSTSIGSINCEHSIPQSWFGKSRPMVSDIHHLYPTFMEWNSNRSSDPFAEIPDSKTTKWMRGTASQSGIPTVNIDEYSEDNSSHFEPREDHKGNLARTAFYFYTMYPSQAGNITRLADLNTLYQWHLQDPVDDRERERNRRTEVAQGNRNPYIDYPELVAKAWGLAPVACSPTTQITNLTVAQKTTTTITLNWANGSGDSRLIVVKEGSATNLTPTGTYTGINSDFSVATDQGNGNRIVYANSGSSVTITGLKANTSYYVQGFESCASDKTYNTTSAPTITVTTPDYACTGVPTAVTALTSADVTQNGFTLSWTSGSGDGRMVVIRKDAAPAFIPQAGTTYSGAAASFATAATLTDGSKLIYNGTGNEVTITGLQAGSLYFVQVFESCSNGNQYETTTAPTLAITTAAANTPPTGDGNVIAIQDFNGTANDGWAVTSGFSSSSDNTGTPAGQRLRTGNSFQVNNTGSTSKEIEFAEVNVTGMQDVYFELYNSAISVNATNGLESSDHIEVYIALDGADFSTTPEIRISGSATDNNFRYGMNGTATITTAAGTSVEKIFTEKGDIPAGSAPSILRVTIPNGTASVKAKLIVKANGTNEVWNVEDVALYAAASAPTDCDEFVLEDHAGENVAIYAGQSATIGAAAEEGYTYSWSPAVGLSDATIANPAVSHITPGTYVYTVTATKDGCVSTDEVTVTVQALAAPVVADVTICAGQSATLKVSNPNVTTTYRWFNLETGGNLLYMGIDFVTDQLTTTTSYYIEAVKEGVASTRSKVTVTVLAGAPKAATITGQNAVCAGETVTYTATAEEGVTNYDWTLSEGWTIVSGANTAQLTVTAGTTAGNVSVKVANNCGESSAATLAVTIATAVSGNTIGEAQAVCVGQVPTTINGSVPAGGNGTYSYQWQVSTTSATADFIPAAGVNNGQNYSAGALNTTTFIRRVVTSGLCGESISEAIKITVNAAPAKPTITQQADQLTASVAGAIYEWAKDGVTIADATTQTITITEAGSYTVRVQNEVGCYSVISDAVQATVQPTAIEDEIALGITVAPNPTPGKFSIFSEKPLQQTEVIITNLLGSVVYGASVQVLHDKLEVDLSKLPAGLYVIQLQAKQLKVVRKVLVTK